MDTQDTLICLGISLGLGLLVGLQRERKGEELAGIRTFALITLWGTISALVAQALGDEGTWIIPSGAITIAILMAVGGYLKARNKSSDIGLTTEFAALVMFGIGAYLVQGDRIAAVVVGGTVALLLHWKGALHGFVRRMDEQDMSAIMQFVLIALVILPVLPWGKYGWYEFFNPREAWLVVVMVVAISLVGYVLYKFVPPRAGAILGGAVGGLVSSTATTVAYARRASEEPRSVPLAAQAIMASNTVSVARVMVLLLIFAGGIAGPARQMLIPLAILLGVMIAISAAVYRIGRHERVEFPKQGNPTELKSALYFAVLYALVKLAVAWGKETFGANGLYAIGALSGLTDMDAITLSISQGANGGSVQTAVAWRVIVIAAMSNLVFKAGCVAWLGPRRLLAWVTLMFGIALAAGLTLLFLNF